jgi:DNA-binding MarR family transcriptional regulator
MMNEHGGNLDDFTRCVLEILRVHGLMIEAGDRLTAPAGLSSARWQVLGVVEHGPAPVATVARTMGLTRQSVQQTADALERDGLIEYRENPHHRRAKLMCLTPAGRDALDDVQERHAGWSARIGGQLDPESLRAATELLLRLGELLKGERRDEEAS